MCISVKKKFDQYEPKPKRAKEDILVYKVLKRRSLGLQGLYYPLIINRQEEAWKKGFIYYETNPFNTGYVRKKSCHFKIEGRCFYSYTNKRTAIRSLDYYHDDDEKVVKMYIPKGGLYYEGLGNVIVSDRLWYV